MRAHSLVAVLAVALSPAAFAAPPGIPIGQIDTFTANTAGWTNGNVVTDPAIVAGGPGGAADNFMRISADGSGSGGRLTVFNTAQWVGNYLDGGVTAIEMDLRNLGSSDLQIRLGFKQTAGFGASGYCSSTPVSLPAGGGWVHAVFPINAGAFTAVNSPATFESVFTGITFGELRILHATSPLLTGSTITGSLGIDNIRAVPAPSAAAILLIPLLARRRRR